MPDIIFKRKHRTGLRFLQGRGGVNLDPVLQGLGALTTRLISELFVCAECPVIDKDWFEIFHEERVHADEGSRDLIVYVTMDEYPGRYPLVEPGKKAIEEELTTFLSNFLDKPRVSVRIQLQKRASDWSKT